MPHPPVEINYRPSKSVYDPSNLRHAPGLYFYHVEAGSYAETKPMLLIK